MSLTAFPSGFGHLESKGARKVFSGPSRGLQGPPGSFQGSPPPELSGPRMKILEALDFSRGLFISLSPYLYAQAHASSGAPA